MRLTTKLALSAAAFGLATTPASAAQVMFNLINIGGVNPGSNAFKGFNAAANYWSSVLNTAAPVTVNINVGFQSLAPGVLGSTGSSRAIRQIPFVQNRIAARGTSALDAQIVAGGFAPLHDGENGANSAISVFTPGYTGVDAFGVPYGIDNSTKVYDTDGLFNTSWIAVNTANAKAIGYGFAPGNIDAQIQFSSDFRFDFNPRNGILAGTSDFYAVAIHEIGHALGFVSGVDDYDFLGTGGPAADEVCFNDGTLCKDYPAQGDWWGTTLDLFRYSAPGAIDWTTNTPSYFSVDQGASAFQNGLFSTGTYNGDSWQASHWKAPQLPNGAFSCARPKLGIMNPYICNGREGIVSGLDIAAFDAIGWNTNVDIANYSRTTGQIAADLTSVPEPANWALMIAGFGLVGGAMRRARVSKVTYAAA
jgi:hypothetical protein